MFGTLSFSRLGHSVDALLTNGSLASDFVGKVA